MSNRADFTPPLMATRDRCPHRRAFRRTFATLLWFAATSYLVAASSGAHAQAVLQEPDVSGDQLLFFFDARAGRVSFLNVCNPSSSMLTMEVVFYGEGLSERLGREVQTLPPSGNLVMDTRKVAGGVVDGHLGLALVTPITPEGIPVVPPERLIGGFTLANTSLMSAFGENALARVAVDSSGTPATAGSVIDGSSVRYQRFAPSKLMVPVYFDPVSLGPEESDGNRIVLIAFTDQYGSRFDIVPAHRSLRARFVDSSGIQRGSVTAIVVGILATSLQRLSDDPSLSGSGKLFLEVDPLPIGSIFGLFSQSLGTFASGHRMTAF